MSLKLITWNVQGRVKDAARQIQALAQHAPDVVALQDVSENAVEDYCHQAAHLGLSHAQHTCSTDAKVPSSVMFMSRYPIERLVMPALSTLLPGTTHSPHPELAALHWRLRSLPIQLHSSTRDIEIVNVYVTPANHKEIGHDGKKRKYRWIKLDTMDAIYRYLSRSGMLPRILCEDFNTPRAELSDGTIHTWGCDKEGRIEDAEQHRLELAVLRGLEGLGMDDIFRRVCKYEHCGTEDATSWRTYRYDHIFASQVLHASSARYLTDIKRQRLSDHTPLEVIFDV